MGGKEEGSGPTHRRLGRGLGALLSVPVRVQSSSTGSQFGSTASNSTEEKGVLEPVSGLVESGSSTVDGFHEVPRGTEPGSRIRNLPVNQLVPNPRQPRREFDEATIRTLAESIRIAGLMQPVIVRSIPGDVVHFELIAGERRWRAAKLLGLTEIPVIVHSVNDQVAGEWALIENIQREDLNPIDRAEALARLSREFTLTHQQLAERIGMDRVTITNLLRLEDLDAFTKEAVRKGELSQGHAKVLLGVSLPDLRRKLASAALNGGLSVRELERRIKELGSGSDDSRSNRLPTERKPHIQDLERRLSEHLGTKVVIEEKAKKKGSGSVIIDYYSLEQFEGLMARLGFAFES